MKLANLSRHHMTLIEIMIVMFILSLAAGMAAIGINKAILDQKFRNEVSLIVDKLRLAQDMMLILGTDVRVIFTSEEGNKKENQEGIKVFLELETKISPGIERELNRDPLVLTAIKGLKSVDSEKGRSVVKFQSKGAVMSSGLIQLSTSPEFPVPSGALASYICLAGYPRYIYSENDFEQAQERCKTVIGSEDDTALTQDTFSKIPDLMKAEKESDASSDKKEKEAEDKKATAPKKGQAQANSPSAKI